MNDVAVHKRLARTDLCNLILCALSVIAAVLATNPFVEIAFNDDWTYAFSVRELLRSGKMTYHCGESAAFLTQAYWGALVAKVFGFSFVVLRLSTLPWAIGCVVACYLLARRAQLASSLALLVALLLALSPEFLPLAASFMSGVPGLFAILFSIYAFALAAETKNPRYAAFLLAIAFATTLLGGLSRQITWIIPITSGLYVAVLWSKHRAVMAICLLGIAVNLVVAFFSARWFYAQPFVVSEWSFATTMHMWAMHWQYCLLLCIEVLLTTLLLALPIAIPAASTSLVKTWRNLGGRRGILAVIIAIPIVFACGALPALSIEPWLGDIISPRGVLWGMELSGRRPISQPMALREILAGIVIAVAWLLLIEFADAVFRPKPLRRLRRFFQPAENHIAMPSMFLFAAGYLLLIAYRAPRTFVYDRYSLPLIPIAAIVFLRMFHSLQFHFRGSMTIACVALVFWAAYAVLITDDVHALAFARRAAIDRLQSAGVADTVFVCGSECDNWTQLIHQGHINMQDIIYPKGKYEARLGLCPSLHPLYRVEFAPSRETMPSEFGTVDYSSWLPPFHRRIFIDKFRNPAWLNPKNTLPPPLDYEDFRFE